MSQVCKDVPFAIPVCDPGSMLPIHSYASDLLSVLILLLGSTQQALPLPARFLASHPSLHRCPCHPAVPFPLRFCTLQLIIAIIIKIRLAIRLDSVGLRECNAQCMAAGIYALITLVARH